MSEIWKIFLTSSITIIGGVLIYVSGQIISKFFIDPIHEQKKVIGEIADALIFYADVYSYLGRGKKEEKMNEASERFRQLATLLQSKTHLIPWYKKFSTIKIVRSLSDIEEASSQLMGLSKSIHGPPEKPEILSTLSDLNIKSANNIKKLLGLRIK